MKWSKVKQLVERRFAKSICGRVAVFSTRYQCSCGRGWITIDGREIADLSTLASGSRYGAIYHETTHTPCVKHPAIADNERTPGQLVEIGEFSRFDLHEACWKFLHSSIAESLSSPNPLIKGLAILDGRVGRQRLERVAAEPLHPLVKALLRFRIKADHEYRSKTGAATNQKSIDESTTTPN